MHRPRINLQRRTMSLPPMRDVSQLRSLHLSGMRSLAQLRGLHLSGLRSLAQLCALQLQPGLRSLAQLLFLLHLSTWVLGVLPWAMLLFPRPALLRTGPVSGSPEQRRN